MNVGKRLAGLVGLSVVIAALLTGLGLYGMSISNASIKTVFDDRIIPLKNLSTASGLMQQNNLLIASAINDVNLQQVGKITTLTLDAKNSANTAIAVEHNIAIISSLWKDYMETYLTPEEKVLADKFSASRAKYVNDVLKPSIVALRANDYKTLKVIQTKAPEIFNQAYSDMDNLKSLQVTVAKSVNDSVAAHYSVIRNAAIISLLAALATLVWLGTLVIRSITNPLKQTIGVFDAIANNKFDTPINVQGNNELSQVLTALKNTQETLSSNIAEQQTQAEATIEQSALYEGQLAAISKSMGVIEFSMDGKVTAANDIFLNILGYSASEAVGQHHSTFVESAYKTSAEYRQFWETLNRGEAITGQFSRLGKNGKEIWLEATYNPILCAAGKPYKVVKYAHDVTDQKLKNADFEGQISAISKSQGIIEVCLDGIITKVNQVYLDMLGYTEAELLGKHISLVLDQAFVKSDAYKALWDKLKNGGSDTGQYKRIAKDGREIWIQASYNPIYDLKGKPYKIVNYTMDITAQKLQAVDHAGQLSGIHKTQGVIEFDLTGKILSVNDNFAKVTGYSEKEIVGNHHSMFIESTYANSHEYKAFWEALGRGEAQVGQFNRIGKGGKHVWLQAIYNPILDMNGKPFKVVKYAVDITEQRKDAAALEEAVEETQGVIENAKSGDLTGRVSLDGKTGAIASLCEGVNALMDKMTEVIVQVREAGDTINTAAGEISSGNNDLSQRTEQQASRDRKSTRLNSSHGMSSRMPSSA